MKFLISLVLLLSLSACSTAFQKKTQNTRDKSDYYLQIGISELVRKNYRPALLNLTEAKKLNSNDPLVLNNLGLAYFGLEQYAEAEREFLAALNEKPDYTEAKNNLGGLYVTTGNYKKAIDLLSSATLDLTYDKPDRIWLNLGLAYFFEKQYSKSETAFLKTLDLQPSQCEATYYYGRSLFERKSYKLSAQTFDRAVQRCKEFDEPLFYGALSFIELKNKERAAGRLRELLAQYPKSKYTGRAKELLEIL